jgi:hypothetical protein
MEWVDWSGFRFYPSNQLLKTPNGGHQPGALARRFLSILLQGEFCKHFIQ